MRKHKWIGNQCIKCGLLRDRKKIQHTKSILTQEIYDEITFEYYDGANLTLKRPDCKLKSIL